MFPEEVEERNRRLPGYRTAFAECKGFEYSKVDERRLRALSKSAPSLEAMESIGRQTTAWANFTAVRTLMRAEDRANQIKEEYWEANRKGDAEKKVVLEREMKDLRRRFEIYEAA